MPFTARTKARKRALDLLFAGEARSVSPVALLEQAVADGEAPTNEYTAVLVRGVVADQERIDALISGHSQDWSLGRMPAVDRNVLRIAVWELLHASDVPAEVAISEAILLVRELSTDESPAFVNGLLAAVHKDTPVGG